MISHVCAACGFDLARVPVRREPIYGLGLVTCRRCGTRAVRRRHPLSRFSRRADRVLVALAALVAQVAVGGTVLAASVGLSIGGGHVLLHGLPSHPGRILGPSAGPAVLTAVTLLLVVAVPLGTWITVGFAHRDRRAIWIGIAIALSTVLAIDTVIVPLLDAGMRRLDFALPPLDVRGIEWMVRLLVLTAVLSVAGLGVPVGNGIVTLQRRIARHVRRARRRRRRERPA